MYLNEITVMVGGLLIDQFVRAVMYAGLIVFHSMIFFTVVLNT